MGDDSGSAYILWPLYDLETRKEDWIGVKKLTASDAAAHDRFGYSVSISGDRAIVGAYGNDGNGTDSGSAYFFHRNQGGTKNWGEVYKFFGGAAGDEFGRSAYRSAEIWAIVGVPLDDDDGNRSGSAYIFRRMPI